MTARKKALEEAVKRQKEMEERIKKIKRKPLENEEKE